MASRDGIVIRVSIDGLRATLAAFRDLPKDASVELKDRTRKLTESLARKVAAAGRIDSPQSRLVARTVKAHRDRLPVISAGGSRKVGRLRAPASGIVFGSEFGMRRRSGWYVARKYADSEARQYRPHRGRASYWFFDTVERNEAEIGSAWLQVADKVAEQWGRRA